MSNWLVILGKGNTRERGVKVTQQTGAQCWGIGAIERYPEITMLWELHEWDEVIREINPVQNDTIPVMMQHAYPDVPAAKKFPITAMRKIYTGTAGGALYANNTVCYMLMFALAARMKDGERRFKNIYLAGVDYRSPSRIEIEFERACTEFWIGRAMEQGVSVYFPDESNLMTFPGYQKGIEYGYTKGYQQLISDYIKDYDHGCAEMLLQRHGKPEQVKNHDHNAFYQYMVNCVKRWKKPTRGL